MSPSLREGTPLLSPTPGRLAHPTPYLLVALLAACQLAALDLLARQARWHQYPAARAGNVRLQGQRRRVVGGLPRLDRGTRRWRTA